jgi:predicted glycoside hydrolase/deacetylase ChbG (UPF0249 family)
MRVIFNGDDFGLTSGINKGIIQSFRAGLLSSASLVVCGEASEEAISLAKDNPKLDIGIHLTLCDERSLVPPDDRFSAFLEGSSFPSKEKILYLILTRKMDYSQVETEWTKQIEKTLNSGILISHIDGHQFIHLFPGLFPLCLRLAENFGIPYVRTTFVDMISLEAGFKRLLQWILMKLWIGYFVSRRLTPPVKSIPSIGFLKAGGKMKADYILEYIDRSIRNRFCNIVEVILHPGLGDEYTSHKYRHWQYNWNRDLELLIDRSLAKELSRRGIEITTYRELS